MAENLWGLTAQQMRKLVQSREVSRVELVRAHLDRLENVNSSINAVVEPRADQVLAEAEAADRNHADRSGLALDGIPLSIKDHFDVQGMKHTEGLPALADVRSPADEVVIQRLKAAGAMIIGKTNQPDLQIRWNTISHLYGATRNPRNLENTAGGSSGGDAAAVAAGMAPIGLGLDYGGSIRVPATFCEIYGLRPSAGRTPAVPSLPPFDSPPTVDLMASIGPLARCVEDLWSAYQVIAGAHPADPATLPIPVSRSEPGAVRPRVARMVDQTGAKVSPEIVARLDAVARILQEAGYEVVDAAIPNARRAPEVWAELIGTELMEAGMPVFGDKLGESNRQHIEALFGIYSLGKDSRRFIQAFEERRKIVREAALWMEGYPLVLCPVAGMPTPSLAFDHLLDKAQTLHLFDQMRNIPWVNLMGIPSVALPNGIQIVGRRFHEAQALEAAAAVERVIGAASVAAL
ncbi:MAG TPA: amidase family protein [Eoetvoesiella sp.]|uniref:amidase n=1 Tax=Eoetvoesiella sp. TaxID=1966355 RepID=UPI002C2345EB|nr:amidase family protein [Eoetvoesiella sp.]HWK60862.1 amidase family protein [Eoetvoesiella sp.]